MMDTMRFARMGLVLCTTLFLAFQAHVVFAQGGGGPVTIDKLTTAQPLLTVNESNATVGNVAQTLGEDLVGGERDVKLEWLGVGTASFEVNSNTQSLNHDGLMFFPTGATSARLTIQWDGPDGDPFNLDMDGLGRANLIAGNGNTITVDIDAFGTATQLTMFVYSEADECSVGTVTLDEAIGYETPTPVDMQFLGSNSIFEACDGFANEAKFNKAQAIELQITFTTETLPFAISAGSIEVVRRNDVELPVELTSFEAWAAEQGVRLQWATASETDNAGFEVQQQDTEGFTTVGFVAGKGTTSTPQQYQYDVPRLLPGRHTFRLKQIDFDGSFAYSDVLAVEVAVPGSYLLTNAYPNPFNPQTQFTLSLEHTQQVKIDVVNLLGQVVQVLHNDALAGKSTHIFTIDGSSLPSGLYLYRVVGEQFRAVRQVLLLK